MRIEMRENGQWLISFPYNPEIVDIVKQCAGRRFLKRAKAWSVKPCLPNWDILQPYIKDLDPKVESQLQDIKNISYGKVSPGSIPEDFEYTLPPRAYQIPVIEYLLGIPYYAIGDDMGTGKTKCVINAAEILYLSKLITSVLVVCPNKVKMVWGHVNPDYGEISKHCNSTCSVYVVNSVKEMERIERQDLTFIIINYELVYRDRFKHALADYLKREPTLMALDEAHLIKSNTAKTTKAILELGKLAARRTAMSGTFIGNEVGDLWAPFHFLNPHILRYPDQHSFNARYGVYRRNDQGFRKLVAWKDVDEVKKRMAPYFVRRLKKNLMDLPPVTSVDHVVALEGDELKLYKDLKDTLVSKQYDLIIKNKLELMLKLQQVASGFFYRPDGTTESVGNSKIQHATTIIKGTDLPLLFFCRFSEELDLLVKEAERSGITYCMMRGGMSAAQSDQSVIDFNTGVAQCMFAQIKSGGVGLNLQVAHYIVNVSEDFSYINARQKRDRVERSGLDHPVTIINLMAEVKGRQTIDHLIRKAQLKKQDLSEYVLDHFAHQSLEEVL